MIALQHQDCPAELTGLLSSVAGRFAPLAACLINGNGPWDFFLPRTPINAAHHTYRLARGRVEFATPSDLGALPTRMLFDLKLIAARIYQSHNATLDRDLSAGCAVVLRPSAYVFLSGFPDFGNFYVQLPGISAHEALSDPALLEQEFPGQFTIEP